MAGTAEKDLLDATLLCSVPGRIAWLHRKRMRAFSTASAIPLEIYEVPPRVLPGKSLAHSACPAYEQSLKPDVRLENHMDWETLPY